MGFCSWNFSRTATLQYYLLAQQLLLNETNKPCIIKYIIEIPKKNSANTLISFSFILSITIVKIIKINLGKFG